MKFILVVGLVCLVQYAASQCTTDKVNTYYSCLKNTRGDKSDDHQDQPKPDFAAMKAKSDECYTKSGCKAPTFEPKPTKSPSATRPAGQQRPGADCMKAVFDARQSKLEACVQKTFPGLDVSSHGSGMGGGMGGHMRGGFGGGMRGGFHGGMGGGHRGGMGGGNGGGMKHDGDKSGKSPFADSCSNGGNQTMLMECFKSLAPQRPAGQQKPNMDDMKAKFQAVCDAKKQCETALGADCLKTLQSTMCECGKEADASMDSTRQTEPACASTSTANPRFQMGNKGFKRPEVDCTKQPQDMCDKDFDSMGKGFGGRGGRGGKGGNPGSQ